MRLSGKDVLYLASLFIFGLISTSVGIYYSPLSKDIGAWIAFLFIYFIGCGVIGVFIYLLFKAVK